MVSGHGLVDRLGQGVPDVPPFGDLGSLVCSVEGWFVPGDVDGVQGLIARGSAGEVADGDFRIFLDRDRLKAVVETPSGAVALGSAAGAVQPDQAFHVVLAFAASGVELFLNGARVDQSGTGFSATFSPPLAMMTWPVAT